MLFFRSNMEHDLTRATLKRLASEIAASPLDTRKTRLQLDWASGQLVPFCLKSEYLAPGSLARLLVLGSLARLLVLGSLAPLLVVGSLARLLVVGDKVIGHELTRAVRMDVARHVSLLCEHVSAQLVEALGRDHVALAVDLPRDRSVARGAGGRASVDAHVGTLTILSINDHALDELQVFVLRVIVVDDSEDLRLHADLLEGVERGDRDDAIAAEDTLVEGRLHLPVGAARAGRGVRPVDLVRLTHVHVRAVLPFVRRGELRLRLVVVAALEATTHRCILVGRTGACHLIVTRVERRSRA